MRSKKAYDVLVQNGALPLFSQPWWLDSICGSDNWDVIVVEESGKPVAAMPYYIRRKSGLVILSQPPLTQTLGPFLLPSSSKKNAKCLSRQKKLMGLLIEELPSFDLFNQNFHYSITNWLPFYWKGFNQTTRYTYVLNNLLELDRIWGGFQEKVKTDIRKAKKQVNIEFDLDIDSFLDIQELTFRRQNKPLPYARDLVINLDLACNQKSERSILCARDCHGQIHAAIYIVWDSDSAYYLMGGGNPKLRNSGATSLLIWEAIQLASKVTQKFNFEGSMIESVERFIRAFGAQQIPYFQVSKMSKRAKFLFSGRELLKNAWGLFDDCC